ncbi:hypothetical protein AB1Y20_019463 [Prymnesium parvum]|uniref:EF-hand domain-containing protein n=1 Tax=Prymnesium parvum TaxID=97485 RepID=A0AB34JUJ1_PRYPA
MHPRRLAARWEQTRLHEQEARARVVRLRKDLQREGERKAAEARAARAAEGARAVRAYARRRVDGEEAVQLREARCAGEEEVRRMAVLFNRKLEAAEKLHGGSWYSLFKQLDDEGVGRVTYREFVVMVRNKLRISAARAPREQLQALWRSLDVESTGFVKPGEFGAFMRKGQMEEAAAGSSPAWKAKLAREKAAGVSAGVAHTEESPHPTPWAVDAASRSLLALWTGARALRTELNDLFGKESPGLHQKLASVDPADEDEMVRFSECLNKQLQTIATTPSRSWLSLFEQEAHAGRITYDDFALIVRRTLKLSLQESPEGTLLSVWRALDEESSGYLSRGAFVSFMRKGCKAGLGDDGLASRRTATLNATRQRVAHEEALAAETASRQLVASTNQLEREAEELERQLAEKRKAIARLGGTVPNALVKC